MSFSTLLQMAANIVIIVAGLLYIAAHAKRLYKGHTLRVINRIAKEIETIHDTSYDEIEIPFDLWWEENAEKAVAAAVKDRLGKSDADSSGLPGFLRELMSATHAAKAMERQIKGLGLHVALHAHFGNKATALVNKLHRYGELGDEFTILDKQHDEELEHGREMLLLARR